MPLFPLEPREGVSETLTEQTFDRFLIGKKLTAKIIGDPAWFEGRKDIIDELLEQPIGKGYVATSGSLTEVIAYIGPP